MTWFKTNYHEVMFYLLALAAVACCVLMLRERSLGWGVWGLFQTGLAWLQSYMQKWCRPGRSCGFCLPKTKPPG